MRATFHPYRTVLTSVLCIHQLLLAAPPSNYPLSSASAGHCCDTLRYSSVFPYRGILIHVDGKNNNLLRSGSGLYLLCVSSAGLRLKMSATI